MKKTDSLPPWRNLRDQLDTIFSVYIRLRGKKRIDGICEVCRDFRQLITVCYHIIPRTEMGTRWDPENAVGACASCNYSEMMNRRRKGDHYDMWINRLGAKKMSKLIECSKAKTKYSRDELWDLIQKFKALLAEGKYD